jgi:hypothetical protein
VSERLRCVPGLFPAMNLAWVGASVYGAAMARAPPSLASAAVIVDVTLNTQLPDLLVPSAKLYRGKDLDPLGLAV